MDNKRKGEDNSSVELAKDGRAVYKYGNRKKFKKKDEAKKKEDATSIVVEKDDNVDNGEKKEEGDDDVFVTGRNPPPVRGVAATVARGHSRSISHGGAGFPQRITTPPPTARASALKKPGHRRVYSHGQITYDLNGLSKYPTNYEQMKGHKRQGSKAEFVHPLNERRGTSLKRTGESEVSEIGADGRGLHHRRQDSSGYPFRGHSRQASRTESIYTIRTPLNYRDKIFSFPFFGWKKEAIQPELTQRTVVPNHCIPDDVPESDHPNHLYLKNKITTTKYTLLSFLPKNLFEQFHRFANLYFVLIVLLNWIPAINAFGKEVSMIPVVFVLGFTAIKDIFEDRRRYISDKRINNSTCRVYKSSMGRYIKKFWKDVRVGDLIHLSCNEPIPADVLLLRSSDKYGMCYIDTQNLDGETNLKQRGVPRGFMEKQLTFQPRDFRSTIECDKPTTKIYSFHGTIIHPWGERIPVGKDNLLLRECILKNTDFVEGIVLYSGHESKVMLNNGGPRHKRSELEKKMNVEVFWCVVILLIMCFIGAIGSGIWNDTFNDGFSPFMSYLDKSDSNPVFEGFLTFWTFVVILQVIIPLSLYVTLEMCKLFQVYLIHLDRLMFDDLYSKGVECRALNIPEELGQIEYIFCDKTGTLTDNKMVFKHCSIGGQNYSHDSTVDFMTGRAKIPVNSFLASQVKALTNHEGTKDVNQRQTTKNGNLIQDFFLIMAVCNTIVVAKFPHRDYMNNSGLVSEESYPVVVEAEEEGDKESKKNLNVIAHMTPKKKRKALNFLPLSPIASSPENSAPSSPVLNRRQSNHLQVPGGNVINMDQSISSDPSISEDLRQFYEAESPDELALVDAAYVYDFKLLKRSPSIAVVSLPEGRGIIDIEVLFQLPFDSTRKRMSVIIRHPFTKELVLFCKGADSSMFPKIITENRIAQSNLELAKTHVQNYARMGLRVLVIAKRVLTQEEYDDWMEKHSIADSVSIKRDKMLLESYDRLESNLQFVAATGIEDKLQEGVPETIESLREAGIVVWVLTGDKQETALNIAYSCQLFSHSMNILLINARSKDAAEESINRHLKSVSHYRHHGKAVVVDGKALVYILDKRTNLQKPFLQLASQCNSVLCCRATPLQKAFIVRIVKEQLNKKTMAVGDGANDVSMIQTADVGVGISGQEGRQAVMSSDFAISRFKFLNRLILVHGHWNYDRLSRMILYFFYKNAAFVFVCFWFQIYCGFSGQVMIDAMHLMVYNLLFTAFPPLAVGVLDQDIPDTVLMKRPKLYDIGRLGLIYRPHSFWVNILDALYQSLVIFFISYGAYLDSDIGLWEFGTVVCTSCLFVMSFHLAVETRSWTIIHWLCLVLSIFAFFIFTLVYNSASIKCLGLTVPFWVMQTMMGSLEFWLIIIITSIAAILPRVIIRSIRNTLYPDIIMSVRIARRRAKENTEKKPLESSVLRHDKEEEEFSNGQI